MKKLIISTIVGVLIGCTFASQNSEAQKTEVPKNSGYNTNPPALKFGDSLPANAFVELAKAINPGVVNISTSTLPRGGRGGSGGFGGRRDPYFDMLEQFFGFQMMPQQQRPQQSLGTGFIIREDGLIVTNNHVIAGADVIQVQLAEDDKTFYEARLVGSDDRTDIALIKIDAKKKLPALAMGSSTDLQVGEWVAAFGNPFGQGHTMTKGIISAKGRDINEINRFPLIQTDTPINPGNSGGPLVNLRGQVIGVNAAIDPRAQGIGFVIPIDEVKSILPQLEQSGRIRKGYLGINPGDLDPNAAQQLGLKDLDGAIVLGMEKNGPAAKAGMKIYDVIVELNGKKIQSATDLVNTVADTPVGKGIKAKVIREGKLLELTINIGERPDFRQAEKKNAERLQGNKAPFELGFSMIDVSAENVKEFNLNPELSAGALVIEVTPRSRAANVGLAPGDVILDVNRSEVKNSRDVIRKLKQGTNTLRVLRGNMVRILVL
ncbi:MAG: trypsin-like peptidase domain-containing protein [Proteobacteria bacterium]|jgi:serine protease Do|nr:trypsin-like peptidase domain-containing protein [Pseudomonadota bacterium]